MRDRKDVIRALRQCVNAGCSGCPYYKSSDDADNCVKELFGDAERYVRREPVKPQNTDSGDPICGVCGKVIVTVQFWDGSRFPDFCPWCGTMLNWNV